MFRFSPEAVIDRKILWITKKRIGPGVTSKDTCTYVKETFETVIFGNLFNKSLSDVQVTLER